MTVENSPSNAEWKNKEGKLDKFWHMAKGDLTVLYRLALKVNLRNGVYLKFFMFCQ